jgi:hypothetical protein
VVVVDVGLHLCEVAINHLLVLELKVKVVVDVSLHLCEVVVLGLKHFLKVVVAALQDLKMILVLRLKP